MEYYKIPLGQRDQYLCAHGCGRVATIVEIDNGHEELVCAAHTFNSSVPENLRERAPNPALPHWLNPQSELNRSGAA